MKVLYKIYLLCICFAFVLYAQAQRVDISVDTTSAMVGEPIELNIKVSGQNEFNWPGWENGIHGFEVLEAGDLQTRKAGDAITYMQSLRLTRFDTGTFKLGPIGFLVGNDSLFSQAIKIKYQTIETKLDEIHDIKERVDDPYTIDEFIVELTILFALVVLIVLGVYFIVSKKKPKAKKINTKQKMEALHIVAMKALEELRAKKLWQNGELKAYYVRLTDILRTYIEERYKIPALESTTDEILLGLQSIDTDKESLDKLEEILRVADMVKFAKSHPVDVDHDQFLTDVMEYVDKTKALETNKQVK